MAATSPYSGNDYASVSNFRPYELPINDIYKGLSAQNQFWDAGAARVKGVYDNALNLKLSLEPNKEIRRKYMEDADKQITKLSSMDLSDPSVQRQGFSIFKPLFQDEGIVYDDLTTRHYEKVRNDALEYRNKDNGKQYSDINMAYAMQGYNEFVNSKDRMAGKSAYQNRKEYTPFYDYTEDFAKALKDCKPSSIETQSPLYGSDGKSVTGYMKESYMKNLSAAQAKGCLEAGLSTNASRQLQIEGSVNYRNHPDVLASDTVTYLSGVTNNLSTQLETLAAKKAALLARKDIPKDQMDAIVKGIDGEIEGATDELTKTNHSINKLSSGDYTDMLNNFDNYAGSVYSYKKLYKKALSSAFEDRRELYKADPVQMSAIKFTQDKYLKQLDFSYDVSLEKMKEDHDTNIKMIEMMNKETASGKSGSGIYRNANGEITIGPDVMRETDNLKDIPAPDNEIYNKLQSQVGNLVEKDQNNNLQLYNNLISRGERDKDFRNTLLKGFNYGTSEDEWIRFKNESANNKFTLASQDGKQGGLQETTWFKAYMAEHPKDEDMDKWSYDYTVIQSGIQTLNRKLELGDKQVSSELGGDFNTKIKENLSKISKTKIGNTIISPEDVQDFIEGKPSKFTIRKGETVGYGGGEGFSGSSTVSDFYIDGKKLEGKDRDEIVKFYKKVSDVNGSINSSIKNKRAEVYNKLGFDREPWYFTHDDKSSFVQTIKDILPKTKTASGEEKDMNVSIISSDYSGGIKISVPDSKKGSSKYVDYFRDKGFGTSAEATADGVITVKGTTYNVIQQAINNPILSEAAYQLQTIGETSAFAKTQPGAKVADADITIPVKNNGKLEKFTVETYKNNGNPEFRVFAENSGDHRPKIIASNPYELFEKIGRLQIELAKPLQ